MTACRVLVADDEPLARLRLRQLLAQWPAYQLVAECDDGRSAAEAIARHAPDVVLLDIVMPGLNGLEIAAAIERTGANVVFVSAHAEFALDAFRVAAIDYVLKPVDPERLEQALARALARAHPPASAPAAADAPPAFATRHLVRSAGGLYFVRSDDVDWADAQGNYVRLHAGRRAHMIRDTLSAFEARLDPARFVRVHRSAIVNLDRVARFEPYGRGEYLVVLADGARLTTSRTHGARLHALLR